MKVCRERRNIEMSTCFCCRQLELETGDEFHSTPFLLAVMSGNLETVTCLVNLGAKVRGKHNELSGSSLPEKAQTSTTVMGLIIDIIQNHWYICCVK